MNFILRAGIFSLGLLISTSQNAEAGNFLRRLGSIGFNVFRSVCLRDDAVPDDANNPGQMENGDSSVEAPSSISPRLGSAPLPEIPRPPFYSVPRAQSHPLLPTDLPVELGSPATSVNARDLPTVRLPLLSLNELVEDEKDSLAQVGMIDLPPSQESLSSVQISLSGAESFSDQSPEIPLSPFFVPFERDQLIPSPTTAQSRSSSGSGSPDQSPSGKSDISPLKSNELTRLSSSQGSTASVSVLNVAKDQDSDQESTSAILSISNSAKTTERSDSSIGLDSSDASTPSNLSGNTYSLGVDEESTNEEKKDGLISLSSPPQMKQELAVLREVTEKDDESADLSLDQRSISPPSKRGVEKFELEDPVNPRVPKVADLPAGPKMTRLSRLRAKLPALMTARSVSAGNLRYPGGHIAPTTRVSSLNVASQLPQKAPSTNLEGVVPVLPIMPPLQQDLRVGSSSIGDPGRTSSQRKIGLDGRRGLILGKDTINQVSKGRIDSEYVVISGPPLPVAHPVLGRTRRSIPSSTFDSSQSLPSSSSGSSGLGSPDDDSDRMVETGRGAEITHVMPSAPSLPTAYPVHSQNRHVIPGLSIDGPQTVFRSSGDASQTGRSSRDLSGESSYELISSSSDESPQSPEKSLAILSSKPLREGGANQRTPSVSIKDSVRASSADSYSDLMNTGKIRREVHGSKGVVNSEDFKKVSSPQVDPLPSNLDSTNKSAAAVGNKKVDIKIEEKRRMRSVRAKLSQTEVNQPIAHWVVPGRDSSTLNSGLVGQKRDAPVNQVKLSLQGPVQVEPPFSIGQNPLSQIPLLTEAGTSAVPSSVAAQVRAKENRSYGRIIAQGTGLVAVVGVSYLAVRFWDVISGSTLPFTIELGTNGFQSSMRRFQGGRPIEVKEYVISSTLQNELNLYASEIQSAFQAKRGFGFIPSLLLHGPAGTEKAGIVKNLAKQAGADIAYVRLNDFADYPGREVSIMKKLLKKSKNRRMVIYIEQIERFYDGSLEAEGPLAAIDFLFGKTLLDDSRLAIIASADCLSALPNLRIQEFQKRLVVELPSFDERKLLIIQAIKSLSTEERFQLTSSQTIDDSFIHRLSEKTEGLSHSEIHAFIEGLGKDPIIKVK